MRHQSHSHSARVPIDAGRQVAQLRHVLRLVDELSGQGERQDPGDADLDESARIASLYHEAEPVAKRRFDALALETARWSAAGVEALLAAGECRSPAAVRTLARELEKSLSSLRAVLHPVPEQAAASAIPSPGRRAEGREDRSGFR